MFIWKNDIFFLLRNFIRISLRGGRKIFIRFFCFGVVFFFVERFIFILGFWLGIDSLSKGLYIMWNKYKINIDFNFLCIYVIKVNCLYNY